MVDRAPSREVLLRPRTLLVIAATALAVAAGVWVLLEAWQVLTWIVIAIFLAIALTPAVDALERRGLSNGVAVPTVCLAAVAVVGLLAWALVPPLIRQTTELIQATPRRARRHHARARTARIPAERLRPRRPRAGGAPESER